MPCAFCFAKRTELSSIHSHIAQHLHVKATFVRSFSHLHSYNSSEAPSAPDICHTAELLDGFGSSQLQRFLKLSPHATSVDILLYDAKQIVFASAAMDGESQAQREARLRSLWEKLDTKRKGNLDYEALKRGLVLMNHREWPYLHAAA